MYMLLGDLFITHYYQNNIGEEKNQKICWCLTLKIRIKKYCRIPLKYYATKTSNKSYPFNEKHCFNINFYRIVF